MGRRRKSFKPTSLQKRTLSKLLEDGASITVSYVRTLFNLRSDYEAKKLISSVKISCSAERSSTTETSEPLSRSSSSKWPHDVEGALREAFARTNEDLREMAEKEDVNLEQSGETLQN